MKQCWQLVCKQDLGVSVRVSSENLRCVCVGLCPCPEERRSQFGEGEVLKQLQS